MVTCLRAWVSTGLLQAYLSQRGLTLDPRPNASSADHELKTHPLAKQIMLGKWVIVEPLILALFVLSLVVLLLGPARQAPTRKSTDEKQSIHAH